MEFDIPETAEAEPSVPRTLAPSVGSTSSFKNWAEVESVRNRIKLEIAPLLDEVRSRRAPLNAMWASMWKVWTLEHETQGYEGRSNIYAPVGKKAIETLVTQAVAATFPGEENFTVEKLAETDSPDMVADMKALMQYRIENTARLRATAEKFYRQLFVTGNSVLKINYIKKCVQGKGYKSKGVIEDKEYVLQDGPIAEVPAIENVYYWPEDVNDVRDAEIVFEDLSIPAGRMKRRAKEGKYVQSEVDEAAVNSGVKASEKQLAGIERLTGQGLTPAQQASTPSGYGRVDVTEVFLDFDPSATSKEMEENPVPYLITMTTDGKQVLRCVENPFWYKRPSYLLGHIGELPGRLYGTGHMEGIQQLQVLLNDQINQGMDCATWVVNPTVLYNPNAVEGGMPDLEPGVAIPVTDINNGVKFDRPPPDLIQTTSILTTQTMGWMMDFSGAPPVLQGGSSPGRAFRTATGIGTANQNAKVPVAEVVKLMEQQVWNGVLEFFFALDQQFATDAVMVRLTGKPMRRVDPRTLGHNWNFSWTAATQTANQQVKGQQLLQALQLMVSPPVQMALQKLAKTVNIVPLLKKMYEEVLGYRDFDSQVLVNLPPGSPVGQAPAPEPEPTGFPEASGSYENESEALMQPENMANRLSADHLAAMSGPMGAMQIPLGGDEDLPPMPTP